MIISRNEKKYTVYQEGQSLFKGTFKQCIAKAKDWREKHGNVDLVVRPAK